MKTTPAVDFIIKVCGITNEEDAHDATEAGANALGFNFYAVSPRYITAVRARQIIEAVPRPFLRVGVFVNPTEAELALAVRDVPLDVVQLHGDDCPIEAGRSYRIWKSAIPGAGKRYEYAGAEAYVLDAPTCDFGGSGRTFDWSLAVSFEHRKIIAGGLDAANVAEAIRITTPWGVDACSRLESKPGKKDRLRVSEFVKAALAAQPKGISA